MTTLTRRLLLGLGASSALVTAVGARAAGIMAGLDTDNDGTVSLDEAKAAAATACEKIDTDHDALLDSAEMKGHLSPAAARKADPDHDKTLTKDEYLALVETRFNAADRDHDGTLDAKELKTKAGKSLLKLLR